MADINEVLQQLNGKFGQLISLHEQTRDAYSKLHSDKQQTDTLIEEQSKVIAELSDKNKTLLVGEALVQTSHSKDEAKEKIDKIVREIDKCISLFNKQILQ
jgi:chaperonin cofactor prefoldin